MSQDSSTSSPAPQRRSRGRRVVRTATAPVTTPDFVDDADVQLPAAADSQPTDLPAEAADLPAEAAAQVRGEQADSADEAADEEAPVEDDAAEDDSAAAPLLPAATLLFQAPDPSRSRRRRRVVAQAGSPLEQEPAASSHSEDESRTDSSAEDSEDDESTRRKRRRGTRGRRRANRDAEDTARTSESDESDESSDSTDESESSPRRSRSRRSNKNKAGKTPAAETEEQESEGSTDSDTEDDGQDEESSSSRRRRRTRTRSAADRSTRTRRSRSTGTSSDDVVALKGSTRLEAKRQRRKEGRAAGRRRPIVTEAEFLARRESVERTMIIREKDGLNQIAVLEDGLLVEHYVARRTQTSMVGNVYVGRVHNVLPSMEAAFVDLGRKRNAVLYAGEVNWDAAGMEGKPRRIEDALKSGDPVLVQVTKDPIGHKGARLTSQITLAGRYLVLVPGSNMTGISRKLPDSERSRLKKILKKVVPAQVGVIVRTAAEGASEEQLAADVQRLTKQWEQIKKKSDSILKGSGKAPTLLKGEPELAVRVVRDVFNEDFTKLVVQGKEAWSTIHQYITELSPDLADRLEHWTSPDDVFAAHRIDEQLAKGFDRKVWLPSGGTLVIDRTEAMTVIDVNTGRFTGEGGTLEETITRNNLEAAEEIVRQLRLRDIGGMVVIDFVDMVLEANRDLVLRRLVECLGRDRTRHQVTEVTSLGLVQMTRKRVGSGLVEAFSTTCECCGGRGFILHDAPVENQAIDMSASASRHAQKNSSKRRNKNAEKSSGGSGDSSQESRENSAENSASNSAAVHAVATIAAASHADSASGEEHAGESTVQAEESTQAPSRATKGRQSRKNSAGKGGKGKRATSAKADSMKDAPQEGSAKESAQESPFEQGSAAQDDSAAQHESVAQQDPARDKDAAPARPRRTRRKAVTTQASAPASAGPAVNVPSATSTGVPSQDSADASADASAGSTAPATGESPAGRATEAVKAPARRRRRVSTAGSVTPGVDSASQAAATRPEGE